MRFMEHTAADRLSDAALRDTGAAGAAERTPGTRHFQSLILPDLVSVPKLPMWLRKPFRRRARA
jgi:hypothetical protein